MLRLKKLEIVNFRSCASFSMELDNLGLCLICGPNGSGKSTIRTAIEYLLTDTTADDIPLDEFTRFNKGDCRLYLQVEKDSKDIIDITKYRSDSTYGNSTILYYNGQDLSKTDRRETQKIINQILGVSSYTLFSTSIFSAMSPSFVSSKESDRKDFLYEIQNISKYDDYLFNVKVKCDEIEAKITSTKSDILINEARIRDAEERLHNIDKDIEQEYNAKQAKLVALENELTQLAIQPVDNLVNTVNKLKEKLKEFKPLDDVVSSINTNIWSIRNKISELKYRETTLNKDISSLEDSRCPLLDIDCEHLMESQEAKKQELLKELAEIIANQTKLVEEDNKLSYELEDCKKLLSEKPFIEKMLEETQSELRKVESANALVKQKIDWINKSIKDLQSNPSSLISVKEGLLKSVADGKKVVEKLNRSLTFLEEDLTYYKFWKVGFSKKGIPNMKCEGFLSLLQQETNSILGSLSSKYVVNISAITTLKSKDQREKISYKILREDGGDYSYASFSGGEKQRIRLADMWAMHKLCSPLDFVILDECLELSLDTAGKSEVMSMLKQLAQTISTVIVISHDTEIMDRFEKVIKFG